MKVLIIEDDDYKAQNLVAFTEKKFPRVYIDVAVSLIEAIDAIDDKVYDLILVDMAIPSHTAVQGEGAPISFLTGGIDVLLELSEMERDDVCIVITQHPSIEISGEHYSLEDATRCFKELLGCNVKACIYYVQDEEKWLVDLEKAL
tara:strand:- start:3293 stop:3730 length:438 start_codon:yes stop_codon:yes gene_type:complete